MQKIKKYEYVLIILIFCFIFALFVAGTLAFLSDRKSFSSEITMGEIQIDTTSGESSQTKLGYTVTRNGMTITSRLKLTKRLLHRA